MKKIGNRRKRHIDEDSERKGKGSDKTWQLFSLEMGNGVIYRNLLVYPGDEVQFGGRPKDEAISGSAEVEGPHFLALLDLLSLGDCDLAAREFRQTNANKAHEAYIRVIRLDVDERARGVLIHVGSRALKRRQACARKLVRRRASEVIACN